MVRFLIIDFLQNIWGVLHSLKSRRWPQKSAMIFEICFHWFRIFLYLSVNHKVKLACSITRDANSFKFIIGVQGTIHNLKKASALIVSRYLTHYVQTFIYYRGIYNLQSDKRLCVEGLELETRMAVRTDCSPLDTSKFSDQNSPSRWLAFLKIISILHEIL